MLKTNEVLGSDGNAIGGNKSIGCFCLFFSIKCQKLIKKKCQYTFFQMFEFLIS